MRWGVTGFARVSVLAMTVVAGKDGGGSRSLTCEKLIAERAWSVAADTCSAEVLAGDPKARMPAAYALFAVERWAEAKDMIDPLVKSEANAEALYIAGTCARHLAAHEEARTLLAAALERTRAANQFRDAARVAYELSGLSRAELRHGDAEKELKLARDFAKLAKDSTMELFADVGRANLLGLTDKHVEAEMLLREMLEREIVGEERALVQLRLAQTYQQMELYTEARTQLDAVIEWGKTTTTSTMGIMGSALLNLSYIERMDGNAALAVDYVDQAARYGVEPMDFHLNRGAALLETGDLEAAAGELTLARAALPNSPDGQLWAWDIAFHTGEIAARQGKEDEAIEAYREAIEIVEARRDHAGKWAPDVVGRFRDAHQRMIGIMAGRRRWNEVVAVVLTLDIGGALQVRESPAVVGDPATAVDANDVIAAWRGRTLIIVVSDAKSIWRLVVTDGGVVGANVGPARELEDLARRLTDRALEPNVAATAAARLAEAIVPADVTAADVLLVGTIGRAPLSMIADAAPAKPALTRVIGVEPRVRHARRTQGALVFGNPTGDLSEAEKEAVEVASRFKTDPYLRGKATLAALGTGTNTANVHIAAHAERTVDGARLILADGPASTEDIMRLKIGANVVFLASCGGAVASDDAGWGSLAAAFLLGGAEYVIAADSSVPDASTRLLVRAFYAAGGADDPVGALTRVQREDPPDAKTARDWASFSVFRAPPSPPAP